MDLYCHETLDENCNTNKRKLSAFKEHVDPDTMMDSTKKSYKRNDDLFYVYPELTWLLAKGARPNRRIIKYIPLLLGRLNETMTLRLIKMFPLEVKNVMVENMDAYYSQSKLVQSQILYCVECYEKDESPDVEKYTIDLLKKVFVLLLNTTAGCSTTHQSDAVFDVYTQLFYEFKDSNEERRWTNMMSHFTKAIADYSRKQLTSEIIEIMVNPYPLPWSGNTIHYRTF